MARLHDHDNLVVKERLHEHPAVFDLVVDEAHVDRAVDEQVHRVLPTPATICR